MTHEHDHEYLHAHGIPHTHGDGDAHGGDLRTEFIALTQYMANHNAAHARELERLAQRLEAAGENAARDAVMAAVSDFARGGARLSEALQALGADEPEKEKGRNGDVPVHGV